MHNPSHANRNHPHLQGRYSLPSCCSQNQVYLLTPQLTPAQNLNDESIQLPYTPLDRFQGGTGTERITTSPDPISNQRHPMPLATGRCTGIHTGHCNRAGEDMRGFELAAPRSSSSDTELAVHVDSPVESSRVCRKPLSRR